MILGESPSGPMSAKWPLLLMQSKYWKTMLQRTIIIHRHNKKICNESLKRKKSSIYHFINWYNSIENVQLLFWFAFETLFFNDLNCTLGNSVITGKNTITYIYQRLRMVWMKNVFKSLTKHASRIEKLCRFTALWAINFGAEFEFRTSILQNSIKIDHSLKVQRNRFVSKGFENVAEM